MKFPILNQYQYGQREVHNDFVVHVVEEDGTIIVEAQPFGLVYDFNAFVKDEYPSAKVGTRIVYTLPKAFLPCIKELGAPMKKSPLMCTYQATKEYCTNMLGVGLSYDDESFFKEHPLVDEDGVSFANTLRVVQELVDPYGIRISRVVVAPNIGLAGDILQWRKVLGTNPKALMDKITTNEEWCAETGDKLDDFRFNHSEVALRPAINCGILAGTTTGVQTGVGSGHAQYNAPRRKITGAMLSFQLARKEHTLWRSDPVFKDVVASEEVSKVKIVFDLGQWYDNFSKAKQSWKNRNTNNGVVGNISSVNPPLGGNVLQKASDKDRRTKYCFLCKTGLVGGTTFHLYKVPGICDPCWESELLQVRCADRSKPPCPGSEASTTWRYEGHCVSELKARCDDCNKTYTISRQSFPKPVGRITTAIFRHLAPTNPYKVLETGGTSLAVVKGEDQLAIQRLDDEGWSGWGMGMPLH